MRSCAGLLLPAGYTSEAHDLVTIGLMTKLSALLESQSVLMFGLVVPTRIWEDAPLSVCPASVPRATSGIAYDISCGGQCCPSG